MNVIQDQLFDEVEYVSSNHSRDCHCLKPLMLVERFSWINQLFHYNSNNDADSFQSA